MQINSPKNLSSQYNLKQIEPKTQQGNPELPQEPGPAATDKTDTVSISAEAVRKQAAEKTRETSATRDVERTRQQQDQSTNAPSPKNLATRRIDLMA